MSTITRKKLANGAARCALIAALAMSGALQACIFDDSQCDSPDSTKSIVTLLLTPPPSDGHIYVAGVGDSRAYDYDKRMIVVHTVDEENNLSTTTCNLPPASKWPLPLQVAIAHPGHFKIYTYMLSGVDSPACHSFPYPQRVALIRDAAFDASQPDAKHCHAATWSGHAAGGDTINMAFTSITASVRFETPIDDIPTDVRNMAPASTLTYLDYCPSTFDVDEWAAVGSFGQLTATSSLHATDTTLHVASDRFIAPRDSGSMAFNLIVRANSGETIGGVTKIKVPYRRGHTTVVKSNFFSSLPEEAGVYINPEFDGDIIIVIN